MKKSIAVLMMAAIIMSTIGVVSSLSNVYETWGSINPDQKGNVEDIANSGVVWTAIGATYPEAVPKSGAESIVTLAIKNNADNWIVLIGGPVANSLTKELVNDGKISASLNHYLKVMHAWGSNTANAMIIFGPDRYATKALCIEYANDLRAGKSAAILS